MKKLIVFDLDGTLAESKAALDAEMATLVRSLLDVVKVAVISGGDWPQFEKQVLSHLPNGSNLANLSILPGKRVSFRFGSEILMRPNGSSKPSRHVWIGARAASHPERTRLTLPRAAGLV